MSDEDDAEFWRRKVYSPKSLADGVVFAASFMMPGVRRTLRDQADEAMKKAGMDRWTGEIKPKP